MKKMLSLAAILAAVSYASPAKAELKIGGDAGIRMRNEINTDKSMKDDINWQYRIRLRGAAELGEGYFFKVLLMNEDNKAAGWVKIGDRDSDHYKLSVSNFYFGRIMDESQYKIGRIPLNSLNNPIFDVSLYPMQAIDNPVFNIDFDRLYGANYGTKLGDGELNAAVYVLSNDNPSSYALHLSYKAAIGNLTIVPQAFGALSATDVWNQDNIPGNNDSMPPSAIFASGVHPWTFGANAILPAGDVTLSGSAFYTFANSGSADYHAMLFRLKGEYGPWLAWFDYNPAKDNATDGYDATNTFLWAQYKYNVYESAEGKFTLQPTIRWKTTKRTDGDNNGANSQLRAELWAVVSF